MRHISNHKEFSDFMIEEFPSTFEYIRTKREYVPTHFYNSVVTQETLNLIADFIDYDLFKIVKNDLSYIAKWLDDNREFETLWLL